MLGQRTTEEGLHALLNSIRPEYDVIDMLLHGRANMLFDLTNLKVLNKLNFSAKSNGVTLLEHLYEKCKPLLALLFLARADIVVANAKPEILLFMTKLEVDYMVAIEKVWDELSKVKDDQVAIKSAQSIFSMQIYEDFEFYFCELPRVLSEELIEIAYMTTFTPMLENLIEYKFRNAIDSMMESSDDAEESMGLFVEEDLTLPDNPLLLSRMRKNMQNTESSSEKDDAAPDVPQDIGIGSLSLGLSNLQLK